MGANKEITMKKQDVFRKALMMMNIMYDKIKDNEESSELMYCNAFYDTSLSKCSTLREWSWLKANKYYDETDFIAERADGLNYSVQLPYDLGYILKINGEYNVTFEIEGDRIYASVPVRHIQYIVSDYDIQDCPDIYGMLVACMLAIDLAPVISPDSNMQQKIATMYQTVFAEASKIDESSTRRANPRVEDFIP